MRYVIRALRAVCVAAYVGLTVFFAWAVFDPRSVQGVMLLSFGVLCAIPAFLLGRRVERKPRRVSSTPIVTD